MRDLFVAFIILAPLPVVALGRPDLGVLLWLWISYMNPHRLAYGFAYTFPFAMIVGTATLIGWGLSPERKGLPWMATTWLLIAFAGWMTFTSLFALEPSLAYVKWDRTIKIMLGAFLTLGIMRGRDRVQALAWVTAGSLAYYGVKGGIFTILNGGENRVLGPPDSFIADNNQLAVAMLMIIPLLRYLQMTSRRWWMRSALFAALALTLLSILGTYSRGAMVGLAAAALFLWLKSRQKIVIAVVMAGAILAAVNLMPDQWFDRVQSTADYQTDSSSQGRFDAWRHAVTVATARPLTGGGFGTFSAAVFARYTPGVEWRAAHNIYFEVLGEQGFIGLALLVAIQVVMFRNGTWIIRKARPRPDLAWAADLAGMLQVCLVAYAVGGAFLSLGYFDLFYGLVVMMALTRLEVARVLAEPQTATDHGAMSMPGVAATSTPRREFRRY